MSQCLRIACLLGWTLWGCLAFAQAQLTHRLWGEVATARPQYQVSYALSWHPHAMAAWSAQAGLSLLPEAVAVPVALYYAWGGNTHRAVVGAGATVLTEGFRSLSQAQSDTYLFLYPAAGYQWFNPGGRWSLRLLVQPSWRMDPAPGQLWDPAGRWLLSGQVGLGYRLRGKG